MSQMIDIMQSDKITKPEEVAIKNIKSLKDFRPGLPSWTREMLTEQPDLLGNLEYFYLTDLILRFLRNSKQGEG